MALIDLPIVATVVLGVFLMKKGSRAMGKPTIAPFFFYTGKFLLFIVWALFAFVATFPQYRSLIPCQVQDTVPKIQKIVSAILLIPANLIIIPAYLVMGEFTHVGLPEGKHQLKTSGIYSYSRNPMYSSFLFLNVATFLYLPSLALLFVMIYGSVVHHFIVLGEEKYLSREFGDEYRKYQSTVRRYI